MMVLKMSDRQTNELTKKLSEALRKYCAKEHCRGQTCHECQATTVVNMLEDIGFIRFKENKKDGQ
jgi:hypothetical protein